MRLLKLLWRAFPLPPQTTMIYFSEGDPHGILPQLSSRDFNLGM